MGHHMTDRHGRNACEVSSAGDRDVLVSLGWVERDSSAAEKPSGSSSSAPSRARRPAKDETREG